MSFVAHTLRSLLGLYAILQLLHFALPYITDTQRPWMASLAKICEPGIRIGNNVAAKLLPDRQYKIDIGPLACVILCWIARMILNFFA